ncbi:hypothetical protein LARV_02744 [Longilinea arvoryzae]|uniref:Uncharacterized protein n=1 Tax=Longilinea arvoryzae TaxID=360412 RepID=A0A0S7BIN4_9CHLR|nr:hypothetical protein [Longilinea arvoryzae]GAP14964.1 hypothetical protein LARV_02744 [Longilinea arvoryzae]
MSVNFLKIYLFDIDGVLVKPLGYRQGVRTVLQEYAERWGVRGRLAGEEEISLLESQQITSEWDQIPICLACMLDEGLDHSASRPADFSIDEVPPALFDRDSASVAIDYRRKITAIGLLPKDNRALSDQLLKDDSIFPNLFPYRAFRDLFANTRDVLKSKTTRRFQLLELGSQVFSETYHLPADCETEGLLVTRDISLIPADVAADLLRKRKKGEIEMSAISARPSRPDGLFSDPEHSYSPEAELGLRVAGLSGIPCIGFGELVWLAEKVHTEADSLLKPNRIHALAGMAAASGLDSLSAMQAAYDLDQAGSQESISLIFGTAQRPVEVHIFEDTPVGVLAAKSAVEYLNELGILASFHAWGITENVDKCAALTDAGAVVFSSIRDAIEAATGAGQN